MPFIEVSKMSLKKEFTYLEKESESNLSELCRRLGISRPTGYKWLDRFRRNSEAGLEEVSRRPKYSNWKSEGAAENLILIIRADHPTWGARKIKHFLEKRGESGLPAPVTITEILRRNGCLDAFGVVKN